jgi:3-phytase
MVSITAAAETEPVAHFGDAADDPAVWVDPQAPKSSLIIGNDKQGALETYSLDGALRQRLTTSTTFWGNVDVRQAVSLGGRLRDVVAAYNGGLRLMLVNRQTGVLRVANVGEDAVPALGEGLCLHHQEEPNRLFVFLVQRSGSITQYRVTDPEADGLLRATPIRTIPLSSEAEGCVVDDARGMVYVAEDDVAIWRFDADPTKPLTMTVVDSVTEAGPLVSDVEGLALAERPKGGGVLIASVQNVSDPDQAYFAVYGRADNEFRGTFDVVDGDSTDGCERTDGVAAYFGALGPRWPSGVFVCQDDDNTEPGGGGAQNFKLVDLGALLETMAGVRADSSHEHPDH